MFANNPELRDKILPISANNQSKFDKDYYQDTDSDELAYNSSPIQTINIITTNNQKKLLFCLIEQIQDPEKRKEYLENLGDIILAKEE